VPVAALVAVALPRDLRTGRFWLVFAGVFIAYYAV